MRDGPVTNHEAAAMRAAKKQGCTIAAIALCFRRARTTVQRHVDDLPVSSDLVPQPGRLSREAKARLGARIAAGHDPERVARQAGVDVRAARRIAAEARP